MIEPERIVSLLASGTELVCALGLGDTLVGRSHECDHPSWVSRLPVVSRPTFDVTGTSRDIDQLVRQRLRSGQRLYAVDDALLVELAPDILITQTHCEVCAVSPRDMAHHLPATLQRKQVVALQGGTLASILQGFSEVAALLGRPREGAELVVEIGRKLEHLRERTRSLPRPTVACLEWIDPVFAMGNWGPELIEVAGGTNILGQPGTHSTTTPWEMVRQADPEVLVVAPCGFGLERTLREMPPLAAQPGFADLRAVQTQRVFVADGNLYFNRSGPTLFDTPEILAEMLHPQAFAPRHEPTIWRRWSAA